MTAEVTRLPDTIAGMNGFGTARTRPLPPGFLAAGWLDGNRGENQVITALTALGVDVAFNDKADPEDCWQQVFVGPYTLDFAWPKLRPDFIVMSRRDDGSLAASIVDPHGDHLADARGKLRALAAFAESHGDRFLRIESIAKADDGLRALDLTEPSVRDVFAFDGAKVSALYDDDVARPYP